MYQVYSNGINVTNPEVAEFWDYDKNKDINIEEVTIGSHKEVFWKCPKNDKHTWKTNVYHMKGTTKCPYCLGKKILPGDNDIFTLYPNLKSEWDYEQNDINPTSIGASSKYLAHWVCSKDKRHMWTSSVVNRAYKGHGCPICSNQLIVAGINDFATLQPELLKEWNYDKNDIDPTSISQSTAKKVWWTCRKDKRHSWQASLNKRVSKNTGCPICANKIIIAGINDFATEFPEIALEWSPKNKIKPTEVSSGSKKQVLWKCTKCSKEWKSAVHVRKDFCCPRCRESKGEKLISEYLESNNITYQSQYRISECRDNKPLPFDFAVFDSNGLKMLIEYDGIQHYEEVSFSNDKSLGEENLKTVKKHDLIKDKYCIDNGIKLVRIKYTDYDKIENILHNELEKEG